MSNFQTILVAVFLAFFVFAVLVFSGAIDIGGSSSSSSVAEGTVKIWGTLPKSDLESAITSVASGNSNLTVKYYQQDSSTYQQDLIEAFATDSGPDLFIITQDMIQRNLDFIYKIPYASYPLKNFNNSYIDGADIYIDDDGIIGYPLFVDPIVLYYNKDILSNEGIVYPPETWDELFTLNSTLTKSDNSGTISQSMIALGQYNNINNVKDILATLLIQNDNPIVERSGSEYRSVLNGNSMGYSVSPIEAVIEFFTEFSNQATTAYSWDSSLSNSLDMFTSSKLSFYIGKASELFDIEEINPNLSFNVNQIMQIKNAENKRTFGDIYAVVINKKSSNLSSAFWVAAKLASDNILDIISKATSLPPASRSLLADTPTDSEYLPIFFKSALITRTWADPDKSKSDEIFKDMINNILTNSMSNSEAISKAQDELSQLME